MGVTQKVISKYCTSCAQQTLHNESGKKDGMPRCTYCGSPVSSNVAKREVQEFIRKRQVAKRGKLV